MNANVRDAIKASSRAFEEFVWPVMGPLVGGGRLRIVECVTEHGFSEELDTMAGIDSWQIVKNDGYIRGVASRVQWGIGYKTFTIRYSIPSGAKTEWHKRVEAIENKDKGILFPHLTIQAYMTSGGEELICAAAARTEDVITLCQKEVDKGVLPLPNPQDGSMFYPVYWSYFIKNNMPIVTYPETSEKVYDNARRQNPKIERNATP